MKKILFGIAILISASSFATNPPVDERISKRFKESFPHVSNARWYENEQSYEVLFKNNDITCRMTYDRKGNLLTVRRDYLEKDLPVYIMVKAKETYKGKKIFGVTEVNSTDGIFYHIIMEDAKQWTMVKSDASGNMYVIQKLRKA